MDEKILFGLCFFCSYVHSAIVSFLVMQSRDKFIGNIIHIPYGFVGGIVCKHNINYGFIYFSLITIYQILEEIGNLIMFKTDKSWHDLEGYILGFSYYIVYSIYRKRNYELISSSTLDNSNL